MGESCMIFKKKEREETHEQPTNLEKMCPLCGSRYDMSANFCLRDGQHLIIDVPAKETTSEESVTCRNCGFVNTPPLKGFCVNCGERFEKREIGMTAWLYPAGLYPIQITKFPFELGRDQLYRLPGAEFVSSPHLRITMEGSDFYLTDLNSLNGTTINGHVMDPSHTRKKVKQRIYNKDIIGLASNQKGTGMITIQFKVQDK